LFEGGRQVKKDKLLFSARNLFCRGERSTVGPPGIRCSLPSANDFSKSSRVMVLLVCEKGGEAVAKGKSWNDVFNGWTARHFKNVIPTFAFCYSFTPFFTYQEHHDSRTR
jgi:hypothetical protein